MINYDLYPSVFGDIYIYEFAKNDYRISFLKYEAKKEEGEVFKLFHSLLDCYFDKSKIDLSAALNYIKITDFQRKVYSTLLKISDYGKVITYKGLGDKVKEIYQHNISYQAIGHALHLNPLPLLIPCHRVIKKDGIGEYRFGKEMKKQILSYEGLVLND